MVSAVSMHSIFFMAIFSVQYIFTISLALSDPRITQSNLSCGNATKPGITPAGLIPAFVREMETLSQLITNTHFATYHLNSTLPIYALAQCHQDLSQTDCLLCYAASRTKIPRCLPSVSARIFLDGCFLRYDRYEFFQESVSVVFDEVKCSPDSHEFASSVGYAVGNVSSQAVANGGFGVVGIGGVYALAQCWQSVGSDGCRECLSKAETEVQRCGGKREGRAMNAGCYLRYSTDKFYNDGQEDLGIDHAAAVVMLSLFAAYATYARLLKNKQERESFEKVSISFNKTSSNFKYETLEKATDYFNVSRKLGQGGAGSVYIGYLQNRQTVAVKRLIFNTRQWVDEFFNEVNLINGIQHKNLVKLLGCSIEGPESLLVYEYVPNRSLDQFIFGRNKSRPLTWQKRFNIIVGTAEGLAYLHGGSQERIIHRDIKCSNVLLDENFNPKIADFGLVRCFGADKSHLSTGIAGTIGYMAPEYLVRGQLTEKADVYSFGVLVLEIVMGKRCNAFIEDSKSLLQTVWQLYKSNRLVEATDPSLNNDFLAQDVTRVLQIGLLCTQASVSLRPSMAEVVMMLTNGAYEIAEPNQPPFMNATVLDPESSRRSYSTNSFVSNAPTKVEASSSASSESSSSMQSSDRASRSEESRQNFVPK
ncbi:cysteine-rich receptor-like protein kinase 42 isoform X2 [Mercurialis annua]|uniref:cysteine-rich receptor-like protein kinase 42 isoform X2 n=1 Tax=Mercurialis annua TaxID=3986 RepID=UPI002160E862|nr:cysteine-rich receptor-like protein kinase 42 isoform X2 [Mercurialis annua]